MNHAQLRAFHAVALEGSFTRAARAFHVSQPTLSAQVKALEDSYGVRLFDRRGRGIAITELGRRLLQVSTRLFALEEEAEELLADTRDLTRGRLSLGADSPFHAMRLIATLKHRHPGLSVNLKMGNADEVLHDLMDYRTDVAVIANAPEDSRLSRIPFRKDRVVAILPKQHPLATRKSLTLAEMASHPLILRESGSVTRDVFEAALTAADISLRDVVEIESREAVREAVAVGIGIGIVFESEVGRDTSLAPVPIRSSGLEVSEFVACLADRQRLATVRAAMQVARECAA